MRWVDLVLMRGLVAGGDAARVDHTPRRVSSPGANPRGISVFRRHSRGGSAPARGGPGDARHDTGPPSFSSSLLLSSLESGAKLPLVGQHMPSVMESGLRPTRC